MSSTSLTGPLRDAILSNRPPSTNALIQARALMEEKAKILHRFNNEKVRLDNQIKLLLKDKSETLLKLKYAHVEYRALQSLSAPYRSVPPEIISRFLYFCIPTGKEEQAEKWWRTYQALTQICKHWKNIALGDSSLWKKLHVQVMTHNIPTATSLLKYWLANMPSCNLTLSICMTAPPYLMKGTTKIYTLLNCCPRLTHLKLTLVDGYDANHKDLLTSIYLPALETLSIVEEVKTLYSLHDLPPSKSRTISAPWLKELHFDGVTADAINSRNLSTITTLSLRLHTHHTSDFIKVLKHCTELQVCFLAFEKGAHHKRTTSTSETTLPSLHTLKLEISSLMAFLMKRIQTPVLQDLHLIATEPIAPLLEYIPIIENATSISNVIIKGTTNSNVHNEFVHRIERIKFSIGIKWETDTPTYSYDSDDESDDIRYLQRASGPEEIVAGTSGEDEY